MRWFNIQKSEVPLVVSLAVLHFLVIASFTLARIARDGLFLGELPVQMLPYVYVMVAIWTGFAVWAFGRLSARRASHITLARGLIWTSASLLVFSFWFAQAPRIAAVIFYLWSGAYGLILVSQFWILTSDRVNSRQAKRLFGLIGAAGIMGGLFGGGTATMIGDLIATHWILVMAAALHVVAAWVAMKSGVRADETAPVLKSARADTGLGLRSALSEPYVRLLAMLFLVAGITSAVLDYEFKYFLQQKFVEGGAITRVLGLFYGAQNVVALIAQLGLAGFILSRVGPRSASMLLPGGIILGAAVTVMAPLLILFRVVLSTRLYDATLRVSLARTSWEFLYFPLPDQIRRPAKRLIEVAVSRSADAGAGLLVLGLNAVAEGTIRQISFLVLILASAWMMLEFVVSRAYRAQTSRPLRRAIALARTREGSLPLTEQREDWIQFLESEDESRILLALEALGSSDFETVRSRRKELLSHRSPRVRAKALSLLISRGDSVDDLEWETLVDRGPMDGEATAEISLAESAADRVAVAAAAARKYGSDIPRSRLPELLEDPEKDVRVAAFRSASILGDREFVPTFVKKLGSPVDRKDARQALTRYGNRIVGTLGDYLLDPEVSIGGRIGITRVLAVIGTQEAALSLFRAGHLSIDRLIVNHVLEALNQIRLKDPSVNLPMEDVRARLDQEIIRYLTRIVQVRSVRALEHECVRGLLVRVLQERMEQSLERIFRRLALVYPTEETLLAHRGYLGSNARLRANALEYLDSILEPTHRRRLIPVLEARSPDDQVRLASDALDRGSPSSYGTIMELLESRETWLNTVALYTVGSLKLDLHLDQVYGAMRSKDLLVRDTAGWALRQLDAA